LLERWVGGEGKVFKTGKFNIDKQEHRLESLVEINHSTVTRNERDIRTFSGGAFRAVPLGFP
jgi:hypothetical protein